ncbi:MAG TPA: hypothetical protein PLK94_05300 [Alphaproteobacteria bacterium]|nr:hypothetical protein [Alphaproteobacteria bacterium]HOO50690.1 hypothetical protein [Alphaproteobacteria bacterium]
MSKLDEIMGAGEAITAASESPQAQDSKIGNFAFTDGLTRCPEGIKLPTAGFIDNGESAAKCKPTQGRTDISDSFSFMRP